jgi:hypothetical protein
LRNPTLRSDGGAVEQRIRLVWAVWPPTRLLLIGKQDPGFVRKTLQVLRRFDLR